MDQKYKGTKIEMKEKQLEKDKSRDRVIYRHSVSLLKCDGSKVTEPNARRSPSLATRTCQSPPRCMSPIKPEIPAGPTADVKKPKRN